MEMGEKMSHGDDSSYTGLSGLNGQLNYQRRFLSPERAIVTIPTIPFQAFDIFLNGTKVKPWALVSLLISVRSFTQWTAKSGDQPDASLIDSHILMKDHFVFVVALKMDVSKTFHDVVSPKFPLTVEANVTQVGNGSSRRRYVIRQASMTSPYVTCDMDDVVISKRNRRPALYPDWWTSKFGYINRKPKTKFRVASRTDEKVMTNECTVEYEHLDHNKHTTTSAYLLFCFNALFNNVMRTTSDIYDGVSLADFKEGVKSVTMVFHKESNFGDRLVIESWEPRGASHTVNFNIRKIDGSLCSSISIELYAPSDSVSSRL